MIGSDIFLPNSDTTLLTATTSSARVAIPSVSSGANADHLNLHIDASATVYIKFLTENLGSVTVPVSGGAAGGMKIAAGVQVLRIKPTWTHIAMITGTGTADVFITRGVGF